MRRYYAGSGNFGKFRRRTIWPHLGCLGALCGAFSQLRAASRSAKYILYISTTYRVIGGTEKTSPRLLKMVQRNNAPDRLYTHEVQDEIAGHLVEQRVSRGVRDGKTEANVSNPSEDE
jgi:hypothetical protein